MNFHISTDLSRIDIYDLRRELSRFCPNTTGRDHQAQEERDGRTSVPFFLRSATYLYIRYVLAGSRPRSLHLSRTRVPYRHNLSSCLWRCSTH
ncbi:hypothetical protein PM082_004852 [Marasmius tenuissimus]|nr:hypothetical protein PM082_004852 [Marasmius tenuissimus]